MFYSVHFSILGLILDLNPANERRYKVTLSLIGWVQTWNQPWYILILDSLWPCLHYASAIIVNGFIIYIHQSGGHFTNFTQNSNSMKTLHCCNSITGHQMTNSCPCHHSTVIMLCVKFCSDHLVRIEVRTLFNFNWIWILMEKSLVKCTKDIINSLPAQLFRSKSKYFLAFKALCDISTVDTKRIIASVSNLIVIYHS